MPLEGVTPSMPSAVDTPSSVLSAHLHEPTPTPTPNTNVEAEAVSSSASLHRARHHLTVPIGVDHSAINESTEPIAPSSSSSPLISTSVPHSTQPQVASPTAGLSPLSNLSDEAAAIKIEPHLAASASSDSSVRRHMTVEDIINSATATPSLDTLNGLNTLNANLAQNLTAINNTIASLTAQPAAAAAPSRPILKVQSAAASRTNSPEPKHIQQVKKDKSSKDMVDMSCQSIIECGEFLANGKRNMTAYADFFGKEVEIYTAVGDVQRRHLYRASALAEKFGYATNKVGMYLARRRSAMSGIYQATAFRAKPPGRTGLKAGGYFLTLQACREFEHHFRQHDELLGSTMPQVHTPPAPRMKKPSAVMERAQLEEELIDDDEAADAADEAMPSEPRNRGTTKSERFRLASNEAEASANLALLAQFSNPSMPATQKPVLLPASAKKRTADKANLNVLTPAQLAMMNKRTAGVNGIPVRRIPPAVRKFDSLAIPNDPSYQPGLSPLSPLSPSAMPMQGVDVHSQQQKAGGYSFDPVKLEADVSEILQQQQFAQHMQQQANAAGYMQQQQQQSQYHHSLMSSPQPPRNMYPHPNTYGSFPPLGSPYPGQFNQMPGKGQMTINPNVPNSNFQMSGQTPNANAFQMNAHTPFGMQTPMGMMSPGPMPSFSPYPGGSNMMSPGFNNYGQPSNVAMSHPQTGQPMSLTVSYQVVLHPNGTPQSGQPMPSNANMYPNMFSPQHQNFLTSPNPLFSPTGLVQPVMASPQPTMTSASPAPQAAAVVANVKNEMPSLTTT